MQKEARDTLAMVADCNVLRNSDEIARLVSVFHRDGKRIALPQIALFELTKHPSRWESTIQASLDLISKCPEAIVVTVATKSLGIAEEATGIRTTSVVDQQATPVMQAVLAQFASRGVVWNAFLESIRRHRGALEHEKHGEDSLSAVRGLVGTARPALDRADRAELARQLAAGARGGFRKFAAGSLTLEGFEQAAVRRGVAKEVASSLVEAPSISVMHALGIGVIALDWLLCGGVESARPERVANDVLDLEYVLAGLWTGRLLTRDGRARDRFDDMREVSGALWPAAKTWFEQSECVAAAPE